MKAILSRENPHFQRFSRGFFLLPGLKTYQWTTNTPFQLVCHASRPEGDEKLAIHLLSCFSPEVTETFPRLARRRVPLPEAGGEYLAIFQSLCRMLGETYHYGCRKHPQRYVDEFCFRFSYPDEEKRFSLLLEALRCRSLRLPWKTLVSEPLLPLEGRRD